MIEEGFLRLHTNVQTQQHKKKKSLINQRLLPPT